MTAIVGAVSDDGEVVIGADAAGVGDDGELTVRSDAKVFFLGPYLVGGTGSFRTLQVVAHALAPPPPPPQDATDAQAMTFMVVPFVGELVRTLRAHGLVREVEGVVAMDAALLVGFSGRLYEVQEDFQVAVPRDGYSALGQGALAARGALYAVRKDGRGTAKRAVRVALEAAQRCCASVRGPFVIHTAPWVEDWK